MDETRAQYLKLRADDAEGLQVISACVQDAIARVADMSFQQRLNRFVMVVTRFRWERVDQRHENSERIRAGLRFENVRHVSTQAIDMTDADGLLPLLAISAEEADDGVEIKLLFAGGGSIRLLAEIVDCQLQDMGESWHTPSRPDHQLEAP
jgi:hypothetical protein